MWGDEFRASLAPDFRSGARTPEMDQAMMRIGRTFTRTWNIFRVLAVGDETLDEAIARKDDLTGAPWVYYGKAFHLKLLGGDKWDSYVMLAHEMAHHLRGTNSAPIRSELIADYMAGCSVGVLGATQAQATHIYEQRASIEPVNNHPGRADRIAAVTRGWAIGHTKKESDLLPCAELPALP
jgi:hypothetical protein